VLSRTADHVYWLGRYVERAENLARALDVQHRLSLLPQTSESIVAGWIDTLDELGLLTSFEKTQGHVNPAQAVKYIALDRSVPGSVYNCLYAARENARAVRGAITSEMWETINATWLEAQGFDLQHLSSTGLSEFVDWVKHRSQLLYGVMSGTMLRDEADCFFRMGAAIERADGSARILGARLATTSGGTEASSYYQWSVLLRAMSAFENYRKLFRDTVLPERVAELLILRDDYPRSLRRAVTEVYSYLQVVASGTQTETLRSAGELEARLRFGRIGSIIDGGLRTFLDEFVISLSSLDRRITQDYLVASPSLSR
jgi:uncharacterized alpha-E superfamily protein